MLCISCRVEKSELQFHRGTTKCKPCKKKYRHEYYLRHQELEKKRADDFRKNNPELRRQTKKRYYSSRSERQRDRDRASHRVTYFKRTYGAGWETAMAVYDLRKVARDDLSMIDEHPEMRRNYERRLRGDWKKQYAKRKREGKVAEYHRKAQERLERIKRIAKKYAGRDLGHDPRPQGEEG